MQVNDDQKSSVVNCCAQTEPENESQNEFESENSTAGSVFDLSNFELDLVSSPH